MSIQSKQFQAYLAGFLDGDGSIYVRAKPNSSYKYGFQIASYVAFFQSASSKHFLDMVAMIGYGTVRLRKDGIYEFTISKQSEIHDFLTRISPHLILKKEQANLMLKILALKAKVSSKEDFVILLEMIDSFRELNYSKKRKTRTLTP
jgi:hypothetical protein